MGDYQKTPTPNLVRHTNGTYYLRARFGAGPIRESLRTTNYQTARDKLAIRMAELRETGPVVEEAPETLHAAIEAVRAQAKNDPSLMQSTRDSYDEQLLFLKKVAPNAELRRLNEQALRVWWKGIADAYAPSTANHLLMWMRRTMALAKATGAISRDHALKLKAVRILRKRRVLLTAEQFRALLVEMRQKRNRHDPNESADWVEMMTYGGPRPGEMRKLWCEDFGADGVLTIWGMPIAERQTLGTKNHKCRRVPMTPMMAALVKRIRARWKKEGRAWAGPLFRIKSPTVALRECCKRLDFPHQRVYDLRHTFATICVKSGVDVATFSGWLGHSDGGTLALKNYVHPDEGHSREAAKKVRF